MALDNGAAPAAASEPSLRDAIAAQFDAPAEPPPAPKPEPVAEGDSGLGAPAAEPVEGAQTSGRQRDANGRFLPADGTAPKPAVVAQDGQQPAQVPKDAAQPIEGTQPPAEAPKYRPPDSWSVPAKGAYDGLPQPVKDAIAKRETEMNAGLSELREYKTLKPYAEAAKRSGTDLAGALKAYTSAEQALETDFVGGIRYLCQSYGFDPRQLAGALAGAQTPAGQRQQRDPVLEQRLAMLEQHLQGQTRASAEQDIDAFFSDPANKFAPNVANVMAQLISDGRANGLQDAYEQAIWTNPEIRAVLISEQTARPAADQNAATRAREAVSQARQAGASVTGSPAATLPPGGAQPDTLRGQLEQAFAGARA